MSNKSAWQNIQNIRGSTLTLEVFHHPPNPCGNHFTNKPGNSTIWISGSQASNRKAWDPTKKSPGWWYTYPSEKYESQLGSLFPIYGKINIMFQTTNQPLIFHTRGLIIIKSPLVSPLNHQADNY